MLEIRDFGAKNLDTMNHMGYDSLYQIRLGRGFGDLSSKQSFIEPDQRVADCWAMPNLYAQ